MTEGETSPRASEEGEEPQFPSEMIPTMGGKQALSDSSQAIWTGGKPNRTWTALEDPVPSSINPTQFRPTSIGSSTKSQHYRTTGLPTKFSRDSDLLTFQKKVLNHLEDYGLDTITYLPSPTDDSQMISVVPNHARFTLKQTTQVEAVQFLMYDTYDWANIRDAKKFLLNSIDESLENQMYENCPDDDTFISYWMNLMQIVGSISVDRFDKIKNRIKTRSVNQYSGQDITLMCSDFLSDWKELHGASMYDNNLTMNMLKQIMEAGTEDFRFELRGLKKNLDKKLLEIRYKPYEEAHQELVKEELDVQSVLKKCKEEYRNLLDDGKWPAAAHVKDTRGLNRGYGTANVAERNKLTNMLAHALEQIQGPGVRDKSNDKCKECGQLGHWARDCPKKRDQGRAPFNSPLRKGQRAPNRWNNSKKNVRKPKFPPPKPGESETKTGQNGKTYHWCAKCRNWTISHGTSQHKSKEELQGTPRAVNNVMARVNIAHQPSAFSVTYQPGEEKKEESWFGNTMIKIPTNLIHVFLIGVLLVPTDLSMKIAMTFAVTWSMIKGNPLTKIKQQLKSMIQGQVQWMINVQINRHPTTKRIESNIGSLTRRIESLEREQLRQRIARTQANPNNQGYNRNQGTRRHRTRVNQNQNTVSQSTHHRSFMTINTKKGNSKNNTQNKRQVLFDSGANCWITNDKADFQGRIEKVPAGSVVEGLERSGLPVYGQGKIAWTFESKNGTRRTLVVPGLLVPDSPIRIAGTKCIFDEYPDESITINSNGLTLGGNSSDPPLLIPLCRDSGLPYATLADKVNKEEEFKNFVNYFQFVSYRVNQNDSSLYRKTNLPMPSLTEGANFNLSDPEKELLRWHYRLGHVSLTKVQWMFRQGYLAHTERDRRLQTAACKLVSSPLCTACQYAKQRRKTTQGTTKRNIPESEGALKRNKVFPGEEVSADHFACNPKGRLATGYGKESIDKKYSGGCILVDIGSSYTYIAPQVSPSSHETLEVIRGFEQFASSHGVVIQRYVSDNGKAFTSDEYSKHLEQFHQVSILASVGAHHHNGIAERNIGTVLSITRAMMHHQALHWPDVSDVELWPFAVIYAAYVLNRIPQTSSGQSPLELFSRTVWPRTKFQSLHVWGCPCYVLDPALHSGNKLPRFRARSQRHVFLGISTGHTGEIPLVLNLDTGSTRTHYHVVVDNWFNTVHASDDAQINFDHDDWYKTFGLTKMQYIEDGSHENPVDLTQETYDQRQRESVEHARNHALPPIPLPVAPPPVQPTHTPTSTFQSPPQIQPATPVQIPYTPRAPTPAPVESPARIPTPTPQREKDTEAPDHSDQREQESERQEPERLVSATPKSKPPKPSFTPIIKTRGQKQREERTLRPRNTTRTVIHTVSSLIPDEIDMQTQSGTYMDPLMEFWCNMLEAHITIDNQAYASKAAKDPDTFNWDQAMNSPYKEEFIKAAVEEIMSLEEQGTWIEVDKSNAKQRITPAQWVFRIKRTPDGEVKKIKGRLCLRGDLSEYSGDTFSPVASWSTVRSFLVLSEVQNRYTCTIDFSNAFVQSPLPEDEPVWMHLPRGFRSTNGPNTCLRLKKSLYGHVVAPLLWYKYICGYFTKLGLTQSKYDQCLWYGRDLMLVQYVDDMGLSAKNKDDVDKFVQDLRNEGLVLTQEESFSEFLGIKFEDKPDGSKEMTQTGLIKKILTTAKMEDCNPNSLPHGTQPLVKDTDGEPMKEPWNMRAIVGMLLYLSTNTRPDIAFAVSQVCRFTSNPKQSHATAVKTILRYLKGTMDKGTIVRPTKDVKLDLYVDADFAGTYGVENNSDPDSAKSRMGYILFLSGWPLLWKSQLLSCISTSTTHAEYHSLSSALKVLLPCKWLIQEMANKIPSLELSDTTIHASAFEDNAAAYHLATNQRLTNRTKYFWIKLHWFWEHYNNQAFKIYKCPSDANIADFYTKCLSRDKFTAHRKSAIGW